MNLTQQYLEKIWTYIRSQFEAQPNLDEKLSDLKNVVMNYSQSDNNTDNELERKIKYFNENY